MNSKIAFASDYMEGAHPLIIERLSETNLEKSAGYGLDSYSDAAKEKIKLACNTPDAEVQFLVGGTQTNKNLIPHFFTIIKQHGALLAKGRLLGIQFDTLFTDNLYGHIGVSAIKAADRIREILIKNKFKLCFNSPTNQVFCEVDDELVKKLSEKLEFGIWEKADANHTIIRFATSWATRMEDVEELGKVLAEIVE